jgi:AraC-like DNA-binding protein
VTGPLVTESPEYASYRFDEADDVRAFYADEYSACIGLGEAAAGRPFGVAVDQLLLGPIEVTEHRLSVDMAVRLERDDVYAICLASSGLLSLEQHGEHIVSTPNRAAVYRPTDHAIIRTGATDVRSTAHGLLIKKWALAAELELLLDRPVPPAIALAPVVELAGPQSRSWLRLLRLFTDALHRRDATILQPIVAEPLCHALVTGLLLVSEHRYADALRAPAASCRPRHVKLALDAIHERPDRAHTTASLAALAGVGVRTLQDGFRQHVGVPPMAYLRRLRLTRAHDDLRSGRAATVAEAAQNWGFSHLGRFAAAYRAKYGVLPSAARTP